MRRILASLFVIGALLGVAVMSTGAYFTDSKPGAVTGNLGTVVVATSGTAIDFANLLPGETQTRTVTVRNDGTGAEDIYLAFDNTNSAWSAVNDLGQYGKFVIAGKTYDNLNNGYDALTPGVPGTPIAGEFMPGYCSSVPRVGINYLPHVILLATLAPGQTWTFDVSFQFNACLTSGQGATLWGSGSFSPPIGPVPLNFEVAAFQQGVLPGDLFNGAGRIAPLVLPIPSDIRANPGIKQ